MHGKTALRRAILITNTLQGELVILGGAPDDSLELLWRGNLIFMLQNLFTGLKYILMQRQESILKKTTSFIIQIIPHQE